MQVSSLGELFWRSLCHMWDKFEERRTTAGRKVYPWIVNSPPYKVMHSSFLLFCSSGLTSKLEESLLRDHIHLIQAPSFPAQQRPIIDLLQPQECSKLAVALAQHPMQIVQYDSISCPESSGSVAKGLVYVTVRVTNRQEPHLYILKHIPHEQKI